MQITNSTITYLYCPKCKNNYDYEKIINLCQCGSPLLVNYDYEKAATLLTKEILNQRPPTMWRYMEVLPVLDCENIISLDEGGTSLLKSTKLSDKLKCKYIYFKDESTNPTGSFKARGIGMAVSKAVELGIDRIIIPTAGNAGSALAAYGARAGIKCKIIMPESTPEAFVIDAKYHGAEIELIDGSIKDCGERTAELVKAEGWFSISTLKEPYRIEGKKTMGYELAEQFNYELPDVIIYPTGGGTGLIGMWKAFDEMERMSWIGSKRPKMISVQSEGCPPIVKAFEEGKNSATLCENPQTIAAGLRVPSAVGDFLILEAVYKSKGMALSVSEKDIIDCTFELAKDEGIFSSPEGGASLAALKKLIEQEFVSPDDKIVLYITGSGYKYLDTMKKYI